MTDPEQLQLYRRMSPAKRLEIGCQLHDFARQRLYYFFKKQHPEKTEQEIAILTAKRFLNESGGFF